MKMTPAQITAAYRAVLEVSRSVMPYQTARKIAKLVRALKSENDVVATADRALAERYGGSVSPGGSVKFSDPESSSEFANARAEYMQQEADIRLPQVDISKYAGMLQISPDAICALDGILTFEAGEDDTDG